MLVHCWVLLGADVRKRLETTAPRRATTTGEIVEKRKECADLLLSLHKGNCNLWPLCRLLLLQSACSRGHVAGVIPGVIIVSM